MAYVLGFAYISPHRVIGAVNGKKYHLHLLEPVDKKQHPAGLDQTALAAFLADAGSKKRVVCVNHMATLLGSANVLKKCAKQIHAILVFDNVSNLYDFRIPTPDATRIKEGLWWKLPDFSHEHVDSLLAQRKNNVKLATLQERKRKVYKTKGNKMRGVLAKVAAYLEKRIKNKKRFARMTRTLFGRLVGLTKATPFNKLLLKMGKDYKVPPEMMNAFLSYMKSVEGKALHKVFYRMQKGDDFRELQTKHPKLNMNDWLTLNDYLPSVDKYPAIERPSK